MEKTKRSEQRAERTPENTPPPAAMFADCIRQQLTEGQLTELVQQLLDLTHSPISSRCDGWVIDCRVS